MSRVLRTCAALAVFGSIPPAIEAAQVDIQAARPGTEAAQLDTIDQRVQPCTVCHGKEGRATSDGYYPRIAGKPAGYLFNQLINFRDGHRHFPMMTYMTQLQAEPYLREIATWFADQKLPYPPPHPPRVPAEVFERGRQLVNDGDAQLHVPACRSCHGSRLLGVAPAVPGLLGVSQDYLLAQLGSWRNGIRSARAPDCMAQIAQHLRHDDVNAATAWLASQTVPADAQPDAHFQQPPSLRCGSIPAEPTTAGPHAATPSRGPETPVAFAPPAGAATPTITQRGRELVTLADCGGCHTTRGGAAFAGGRAIPTPFGTFYSPNITPDAATGLGNWTAEDFWHAVHDGYSKDGTLLYPTFPYTNYTRITRQDADAMFAYLRTVRPVRQANRAHDVRFPYDRRMLLAAWRWLFFRPGVYEPDPSHSAEWNRGAYLVQGLGHCSACHEARNALGAIRSRESPSGGLVLNWYAPSLRSEQEAGVQGWSEPDIVTLLKTGRLPARSVTVGPMAEVVYNSLQHTPDRELQAMAVYLKALPGSGATTAIAPAAQPLNTLANDTVLETGAKLYADHCARCHGDRGEGRSPAGPPLAGNRAVTMHATVNLIRIVLFGGYPPGTAGDPRPFGMPPYYPTLPDDQIAAVLTYVRESWGNRAGPVSIGDVTDNRGNPLW
jgi:cytochrome c553